MADLVPEDVLLGLVVTWGFFVALIVGRYVRIKQLGYKKRE